MPFKKDYKMSEEHKEKMRKAHIGKECPWAKNNPQTFRKGHISWITGKKRPSFLMNKLEKRIYKILTQDKKFCKFKNSVNQAFKPFILCDPHCKAKELAQELKNAKR